jgi:hypothetical protein
MDVTNLSGDVVSLYELGMLVKETWSDKWSPKFYFFTAGNLYT